MDPITIAMAAQAGLGAIGSLVKGVFGLNAGNAQAAAERAAATQSLQESGANAQIALEQGDRAAASGAVRAAASGGGLTGSAMGVIADLQRQSMFNARSRIYRGQTEANADIYNAQVAHSNAVNSAIGGVVGSVSSVLGGFIKNQQYSALNKARSGGADFYAGGDAGADGVD